MSRQNPLLQSGFETTTAVSLDSLGSAPEAVALGIKDIYYYEAVPTGVKGIEPHIAFRAFSTPESQHAPQAELQRANAQISSPTTPSIPSQIDSDHSSTLQDLSKSADIQSESSGRSHGARTSPDSSAEAPQIEATSMALLRRKSLSRTLIAWSDSDYDGDDHKNTPDYDPDQDSSPYESTPSPGSEETDSPAAERRSTNTHAGCYIRLFEEESGSMGDISGQILLYTRDKFSMTDHFNTSSQLYTPSLHTQPFKHSR